MYCARHALTIKYYLSRCGIIDASSTVVGVDNLRKQCQAYSMSWEVASIGRGVLRRLTIRACTMPSQKPPMTA